MGATGKQVPTVLAKLTAEFVGTFILCFTVCSDSVGSSKLASISVASSLMVSVYALGSVSGANFNPAVSLGLCFAAWTGHGDLDVNLSLMYMVVQLVAGAAACVSCGALWHSDLGSGSSGGSGLADVHVGKASPLGSPGDFGDASVFAAEVFFTALLMFVVLSVATCNDQAREQTREKNFYFALSIGFVIMAGATAIGNISGCSLNPAVSYAISAFAVVFGKTPLTVSMGWFFFYSSAELVGAVLAVLLFRVCRQYMFNDEEGPSLRSKLVAEFTGTFFLMLTVSLVVAQADQAPIVGVIGIASSLMVMIYSLAAVSGANFNPSVTLGLTLIGETTPQNAALYSLVQFLGSFAGVGAAIFLWEYKWQVALVGNVVQGSSVEVVAANGHWGRVLGAETFYTCLLVFVVLNVAVRDGPNQFYGLAIGFTIVAGGVAVGPTSGGCFNPAVAAGLDIGGIFVKRGAVIGYSVLYWVAQVAASGIASGLYRLITQTKEVEDDEEQKELRDANANAMGDSRTASA